MSKKKILILGGAGRQGSIVAEDLSMSYDVVVADICAPNAPVKFQTIDLSKYRALVNIMRVGQYDLVVGALPSDLGLNAMKAAIEVGVNYVDMSFMEEDVKGLFDKEASEKGITILHDCGIAPGISNMVVGMAIKNGAEDVAVHVGGVAKNDAVDYVISWSPEDLYEEYTRPARIVRDGKRVEIDALTEHSKVYIDGFGYLNSYYTDGLRSLLSRAGDPENGKVRNMIECTMRRPQHIDKVKHDIGLGKEDFVSKLKKYYPEVSKFDPDILAMKIIVDGEFTSMLVESDDISAMSRATAFSCAAFARAVVDGWVGVNGVMSPEDLNEPPVYKYVLDHLAKHNIRFSERYPFVRGE